MCAKRVIVLGATGSIGQQALSVLSNWPDRFEVVGLSCYQSVDSFAQQIKALQPKWVATGSEAHLSQLQNTLDSQAIAASTFFVGESGLASLCELEDVDIVINGISGFAGLHPTLAALKAGKRLLTANKETFVTAGHLVAPYMSQIVPLDSEHSAIFQCLQGCWSADNEVESIYLTASGGPFWNTPLEQMKDITVEAALKHPTWQMGQRITIDSATMMNKGLECIEAHHLFNCGLDQIKPVIHPQSIVHSAVSFKDGAILAQMGQPDMRVPIQYGLSYPTRWPLEPIENSYQPVQLDLTQLSQLTFYPADTERFPCLKLAQWAGDVGGSLPVVLNAADEIAVERFLSGKISFLDIPKLIEAVMNEHMNDFEEAPEYQIILSIDAWARSRSSTISLPEAVSI